MNLKVNLDLGYINKYMKLKFSLYIRSEQKNVSSLLNFEGNQYLQFTPHPMITLEIFSEGDKKDTVWNANRVLNFTKFNRYIFCKRLKEVLNRIKKEKDIYYLSNGRLMINKELAKSLLTHIPVSQKMCSIMPTIVQDQETHDLYEGVLFIINNAEYCYLTFEEACYLAEYLSSIDMDSLSMEVINNSTMIDLRNRVNYIISEIKREHKKTVKKIEDKKPE